MDRVTLYAESSGAVRALKPRPFASESDLRRFAERRLESVLNLRLIASEIPIDDGHRPVVIEFKREATGSTIGQALAYVDWLLAHQDAVALRVARVLGINEADRLDWSAPRLLCVAEGFGLREEASPASCVIASSL